MITTRTTKDRTIYDKEEDYCMTNDTIEYSPGPKDLIPFTFARKFLHYPLKTLLYLYQHYGDISHFKFGKQNIYFLNHPDLIEDVLITNHKNFIKSKDCKCPNVSWVKVCLPVRALIMMNRDT